MPSLKAFRNRIASVKATRKITRAMQMVAASKLKRAQDAAQAARPYAERMAAVISSLSGSMAGNPGAPRLLTGTGSDRVHLVIVATADRGLCGILDTTTTAVTQGSIISAVVSALTSPGGTVDFLENGNLVASAPIVNGAATWNAAEELAGGVHTLVASYAGSKNFKPSVSAATDVHIEAPPRNRAAPK